MLNVENLSFHYRNGPEILRQVSFSLEDGQFLAILGNNGAGKSTMLKCFNQILRVEGGHVWMDGEDLLTMTHREVAQRVAFVSQNIPSTQMTVHDVVMLGRRPYMRWGFTEEDHRIVHEAMDRLHLSDMRGRFLNELSGGEQQMVALARGMMANPKILMLDEPSMGLAPIMVNEMFGMIDAIAKTGVTILLVEQRLNETLEMSDTAYVLQTGKIVMSGKADVLMHDPNVKKAYLGM